MSRNSRRMSWFASSNVIPAKFASFQTALRKNGRNSRRIMIPSQQYLLFVGNVKETKNIQRLISSFARVQWQIPHRLVIIGKNEGFITSDKSAAKGAEDLNARVTFTGSVSQEVLRKYMRGASGFVFPSLYEGFGLPPLEAMAAGIPVAASNTSAIPEVCGDCAIYFDPYDEHSIASALVRLAGLNGLEKQSFVAERAPTRPDIHLERNGFTTC